MEPEGRDSAAPMGPRPRQQAAIPANEWFSGHRYAERQHVHFPVEIQGGSLTLHGVAVDLSASGILVGVPVAGLTGVTGRTDLLGIYVMLHHTWEDGVQVQIPGHGSLGRAFVARIVASPQGPREVLLGLRFQNPLPTEAVSRWFHGHHAPG